MFSDTRLDNQHLLRNEPQSQATDPALRILIVDDNRDTAATMASLLGQWGFEAIALCNGPEALQAARAACPDVVLLAIAMPGRDGWKLARRLRVQRPPKGKRPFLISVSGFGDAETSRRSQEAGIDLHLVKPVDATELEKLLKRFQRIVLPAAEPGFHGTRRRLFSSRHLSVEASKPC